MLNGRVGRPGGRNLSSQKAKKSQRKYLSTTGADGKSTISAFKTGHPFFLQKGLMQAEEGLSDKPRRAIFIDLKDTPPLRTENTTKYPNAFPRNGAKR
jgi:hypothetical protein